VSGEDGFAKPESALLELDSSESEEVVEESESLELGVSGPLLLDSMSKGSDSPDSDSDESDPRTQLPMTRTQMIQGPPVRPPTA
jgi:hypothetical protein